MEARSRPGTAVEAAYCRYIHTITRPEASTPIQVGKLSKESFDGATYLTFARIQYVLYRLIEVMDERNREFSCH